MLTRLFLLGVMFLTSPVMGMAWDLSPTQEGICREYGAFAIRIGESRDIPMPRERVLHVVEQASPSLSPGDRTVFIGLVYWVYENKDLSGTELYAQIITACRNEFAQRHVVEIRSQRDAEVSTHCEHMGNVGMIFARQAGSMTQTQILTHWRASDTGYVSKAAFYKKWVPFVYARKHMSPGALRVAVTQECLNELAINLEQQGVRR